MTHVTPEVLDEAQGIATTILVQWAETGHPPFGEGSELSLQDAQAALDGWVGRHRGTLIGSGVDLAFTLLHDALEVDPAKYEEIVARMDMEAVLAEAETVTTRMEQRAAEAQAVRDALLELRQVAHRAARGALAAGLTAALSSAAGFPQPPTSPRVVGGAVAGE